MARKIENEFSLQTRRNLARRASYICSNPSCKRTTTAPKKENSHDSISTGIAAHICANAENGPRFSHIMKPDEIRSIDNGIWLCSDCSILIDREPTRFPVAILKKWKSDHEEFVRNNHGKKLPSENDAINTLTQAFSGSPSFPTSTAIKNTHLATEQHLAQMDNRFKIESSYVNGATHYSILAKEVCDVQIRMEIPTESKDEFESAWTAMVTEGKEFIAPQGTSFKSDSKLIDHLFTIEGRAGELSITPNKREAIHKISVFNREGLYETFEEVKGFLSIGSERYSFEGNCCKNYFKINYVAPIKENTNTELNFSINWAAWNGLSYKRLPYFSKLFKFFDALQSGWQLETSLEIDGEAIFTSKTTDRNGVKEFATSTFNELYFYKNLKIFLEATNQDLFFKEENKFSSEFVKIAYEYINILGRNGECFTKEHIKNNPSFKLIIDSDEGIKSLELLINSSGSMKISNPAIDFPVNGQNFYFPPRNIFMSGFSLKTNQALEVGIEIYLEVIPEKDFLLVETLDIK